jgi:hypothetical protein
LLFWPRLRKRESLLIGDLRRVLLGLRRREPIPSWTPRVTASREPLLVDPSIRTTVPAFPAALWAWCSTGPLHVWRLRTTRNSVLGRNSTSISGSSGETLGRTRPSSANPAGSHAGSDRGPDVTKQRPFLVHLTRGGITGSDLAGSSTPLRANFRITEVFSFYRKTGAPKYQRLIVLTDAFCARPLRRSAATLLARYRLRRVQEYRLGRRSRSPHRGD